MRYTGFETFTRQITLPDATNDTGEIYRSAVAILDGIHLRTSVRLFGVALSALGKDGDQMTLFKDPVREKRAAVARAMDMVNDKFGELTVTYAATIGEEKGPQGHFPRVASLRGEKKRRVRRDSLSLSGKPSSRYRLSSTLSRMAATSCSISPSSSFRRKARSRLERRSFLII